MNSAKDAKEPVLGSNREKFVKIREENVIISGRLLLISKFITSPKGTATSGSSGNKKQSMAGVTKATRRGFESAAKRESRLR